MVSQLGGGLGDVLAGDALAGHRPDVDRVILVEGVVEDVVVVDGEEHIWAQVGGALELLVPDVLARGPLEHEERAAVAQGGAQRVGLDAGGVLPDVDVQRGHAAGEVVGGQLVLADLLLAVHRVGDPVDEVCERGHAQRVRPVGGAVALDHGGLVVVPVHPPLDHHLRLLSGGPLELQDGRDVGVAPRGQIFAVVVVAARGAEAQEPQRSARRRSHHMSPRGEKGAAQAPAAIEPPASSLKSGRGRPAMSSARRAAGHDVREVAPGSQSDQQKSGRAMDRAPPSAVSS